jgi:hypothetical protein
MRTDSTTTGSIGIRARFLLAALFVCLLPSAGFSIQDDPAGLTKPLEQVRFEQWKEVDRDEFNVVYELALPSAHSTKYPKNDFVPIRAHLPIRSRAVPVVVLTHYWGATDDKLERELARLLNNRGIAAVILTLPYHMDRTPEGYRNAELAILPDPHHMVGVMQQSTLDIRRTVDWIHTKSEFKKDAIGIGGTSLGALTNALGFGVEKRIKSACFMLGGVDLSQILWKSSRVVKLRDDMRHEGWTQDSVREVLAPIEPSRWLKPDGRPAYVISAKYDTVIPKDATDQLIGLLSEPEILELDTGHYGGVLVQSRLLRSVARYFAASLNDQPFAAPESFFSPTLRFGVIASAEKGLQVAGGIDFWRARHGGGFASAMLTPRGVQTFVGWPVGDHFSVGFASTRKATTWGLFWSMIL